MQDSLAISVLHKQFPPCSNTKWTSDIRDTSLSQSFPRLNGEHRFKCGVLETSTESERGMMGRVNSPSPFFSFLPAFLINYTLFWLVEYSSFSADIRQKISWIIPYDISFLKCCGVSVTRVWCLDPYRTLISIEHLATAGFLTVVKTDYFILSSLLNTKIVFFSNS